MVRVSELYAKLAELAASGAHFAVATVIGVHGSSPRGVGAKMVVLEDGTRIGTIGGDCLESDTAEECVKMIKQDQIAVAKDRAAEAPTKILSALLDEEERGGVGMLCGGKVDVLIEVVRPELHVVVLGSGPVATSVVKLADFLDVGSSLVDPMPPRTSLPRSCSYINAWHEEGLKQVGVTPKTAIVIVTRHKNDVPSLKAALATPAGYVGMIGSKHRVQTIFNRVAKAMGVAPSEISRERVHAPVGLDIGAQTPAEIAVSIMAEVLAHFRHGTSKPMAMAPVAAKA